VQITGKGLAEVVTRAGTLVERCLTSAQSIVFCPHVATFNNVTKARQEDFSEGLALSVECDATPDAACAKLVALLGPATLVAASGGQWTDPATGEVQDKLHLHWRLTEPTTGAEDHVKLKLAPALAAELAGSDTTNVPMAHPIRFPGSIQSKGQPRLARIV